MADGQSLEAGDQVDVDGGFLSTLFQNRARPSWFLVVFFPFFVVLPVFLPGFGRLWDFTESYQVLPSFSGCYRVLLGFT